MTSTGSLTGAKNPKSINEKQPVRLQLERIVSEARFAASNRNPQLLLYIVELTLADKEDDLRFRLFYGSLREP